MSMNISRRNFVKYAGLMGGVAGAGALAGCSSSSSDSSSSASGSSSSKIKIGVSIWSSTDALGKLSVDIIKKAADILGVEVTTVDQGHVSEQVTASVETLCAAGCNGIVICNSADSEMTSAINTCNDNGVYLAQFYRMISKDASPDVYSLAEASSTSSAPSTRTRSATARSSSSCSLPTTPMPTRDSPRVPVTSSSRPGPSATPRSSSAGRAIRTVSTPGTLPTPTTRRPSPTPSTPTPRPPRARTSPSSSITPTRRWMP